MDTQSSSPRQTQQSRTLSVSDEPQQPPASRTGDDIQFSDDDDDHEYLDRQDKLYNAERQRFRAMLEEGRKFDEAARARVLERDDFIANAKAELEEAEAMGEADNEARDANRATMSVRVQSLFDKSAAAKKVDPEILARLITEVTESLSEPTDMPPQAQAISTRTHHSFKDFSQMLSRWSFLCIPSKVRRRQGDGL